MRVLWFSFASSVLALVLLIVLSGYDIVSKIALSATFLTLLPMYAVSAMISSWINEHEADVYAIKVAGFKPVAMALVKLHVYSDLMKYDTFITNIEFSDNFELVDISTLMVLKAILSRVFAYMKPPNSFKSTVARNTSSFEVEVGKDYCSEQKSITTRRTTKGVAFGIVP